MWKVVVCLFLIQHFETVFSSNQSIAIIHNVSVTIFNTSSITVNGTCRECLCAILLNAITSFSFNCFRNNNTCEIFLKSLQTGSFTLINNTASSLYFFPQPIDDTTLTTDEITTTTTPYDGAYLWPFDSTYQDLSSTFNGIPMNGAHFNSSSITGYGSSLSLSYILNQSVVMDSPFLNLTGRPWTFEAWIYPSTVSNSTDYGIAGQCQATSTDMCLHLIIRRQKLLIGFYIDDLIGLTSLLALQWYHIAFVFDSASRNQSVYLNGVLDNSRTATSSYCGNYGSLTVGSSLMTPITCYFDGLIDQFYYINRAKNSTEILNDATLTLYFSFDHGSIYDGGQLRINGSLFGSTNIVTGRVGHALQFGPSSDSYFRVTGLVLLGTSNQSYSMSIWINPTVINTSSIIHVSSGNYGQGYWCFGMLSLSSSGQIIGFSYTNSSISVAGPTLSENNWTHTAMTYSALNGLRLYVNGTLRDSTIPFSYVASGYPNYLFLGSPLNGSTCGGIHGQFLGALDEFRLYSRELTASDVWTLSQT